MCAIELKERSCKKHKVKPAVIAFFHFYLFSSLCLSYLRVNGWIHFKFTFISLCSSLALSLREKRYSLLVHKFSYNIRFSLGLSLKKPPLELQMQFLTLLFFSYSIFMCVTLEPAEKKQKNKRRGRKRQVASTFHSTWYLLSLFILPFVIDRHFG